MVGGYDDDDDGDFAVAVAASAHAIHIQSLQQTSKLQISKQHPPPPPEKYKGPTRNVSIKDARSTSASAISFNDVNQIQIRRKETCRNSDSKADAWEKAQIAKIRKRYVKVLSDIQAWEDEKKLRAKQKLERRKIEADIRKSRNVKHYERKIGRIDDIGFGARAQVEEKRKDEELIVKERARKMRLTGNPPAVTCFCF